MIPGLHIGTSFKPTKKRHGGAVRGASNGKLLPGEKKRLKKEKMNAKRAARSASHGLDLETVNAELVQFVASDGDMKVCCTHEIDSKMQGMLHSCTICLHQFQCS